jgi:hypothetical protein
MPNHVVVDGSNIATEGRSMPSLQQLNDAVLAFMEEHPDALITVVVDATFGHRIDPREVPEFDAAIANNELVAPPAGAIGRGDAFVLSIAHKVRARILTNDSYQEFHADYPWLFDEGRLIGGKPVPHIGWVFVNRLPVRGPISRKATSEARRRKKPEAAATNTAIVGSPDASQPMPVPKAPPPRASRRSAPVADTATQAGEAVAATAATPDAAPTGKRRRGRGGAAPAAAVETVASPAPAAEQQRSSSNGPVNELMPYLDFVARHPVGTSVSAIVDHYSSHGAYVRIDDVKAYIPLRLMADPAPRSARELLKIGETHVFVVVSYVPDKRSIDLALPGMAGAAAPVAESPAAPVKKAAGRKAASTKGAEKPSATAPSKKAATKKAVARKAAVVKAPVVESAPTAAASKKAAATSVKAAVAKKAPAKKAAAAKAVAKKSAPAKAAPKKAATAPASATPVAKKAATKKVAAKKAPAKKAAVKKAAG